MSLVMAFEALDGVVLAADTKGIGMLDGMNYDMGQASKLRQLGNGAVGMTGDLNLLEAFLNKAERQGISFTQEKRFDDTVSELSGTFRSFYKADRGDKDYREIEKHTPPTELILVGRGEYGGEKRNFIYSMSLNQDFAIRPEKHWYVIGQWLHGGCYYACRYYRTTMDLKRVAFLAYFCINEVAALDGTVGTPVDLLVLRNNSPEPVPQDWINEFEQKYREAHKQIEKWFGIRE